MARAKQTGRSEARRRYRQTTGQDAANEELAELEADAPSPGDAQAGSRLDRPAGTAERSAGDHGRVPAAYRPAHIRGRPRAAPEAAPALVVPGSDRR